MNVLENTDIIKFAKMMNITNNLVINQVILQIYKLIHDEVKNIYQRMCIFDFNMAKICTKFYYGFNISYIEIHMKTRNYKYDIHYMINEFKIITNLYTDYIKHKQIFLQLIIKHPVTCSYIDIDEKYYNEIIREIGKFVNMI